MVKKTIADDSAVQLWYFYLEMNIAFNKQSVKLWPDVTGPLLVKCVKLKGRHGLEGWFVSYSSIVDITKHDNRRSQSIHHGILPQKVIY